MEFRYEKLEVGKEVLDFLDVIYEYTILFQSEERFGLVTQIRRAVVSVYLNLVEGTARKSSKDFARFITMSMSSLLETHAALRISLRRKYISEQQWNNVQPPIEKIWFKLCALRDSQTRSS